MEYILMHKSLPVAGVDIDEAVNTVSGIIEVYNREHLPLSIVKPNGIVDRASLNEWWRARAIPSTRSGLSDALERLDLEKCIKKYT
jgi:hypothetical protein